MPYVNKPRPYKKEWEQAKKRGDDEKNRAQHRLRYEAEKKGLVSRGDGNDLAHKPGKYGQYTLGAVKVEKSAANKSFARKSNHKVKSEVSKRERKK
jgi:hypothetical protein